MQIKRLQQAIYAGYLCATTIFRHTSCSNYFLVILARLLNRSSSIATFKIYRIYPIVCAEINYSVKFEMDTTIFLLITAHPFKVVH